MTGLDCLARDHGELLQALAARDADWIERASAQMRHSVHKVRDERAATTPPAELGKVERLQSSIINTRMQINLMARDIRRDRAAIGALLGHADQLTYSRR